MCNRIERIGTILAATVFVSALAAPAEGWAASGKIVCWKDNAGKVVGCGDKVPPEFQSSGTKELDSRGVTRKTTESVEDAARRRDRDKETAKMKAEEDRKALDQRRQDTALLDTYANEKEIDVKRDRDLGVIDSQIEQLNNALKTMTPRYSDVKTRHDAAEKKGKLAPVLKDELERVAGEKQRLEKAIEAKHKEKEELRQRFADQRKRYTELRHQGPTASATAPAAAPAKK
jgi:hypothetical protein